jgi:hypothetical protein
MVLAVLNNGGNDIHEMRGVGRKGPGKSSDWQITGDFNKKFPPHQEIFNKYLNKRTISYYS